MTSVLQSPYTSAQIAAWLRGLLTIAWADGDFDAQEQEVIAAIAKDELSPGINLELLNPIEPEELAAVLGKGTKAAENFLRTAVMVAIADGTYSQSEDDHLQQLCKVLEQPDDILQALRHTLENPQPVKTQQLAAPVLPKRQTLEILREWLDKLDIQDPRVARFLCKMIPSQCPFARDITLFKSKTVHIPPLCKLNPLYEQLVGLRFRALSFLADNCGEDVSAFI
ncbi:MAG: Mo-dependent nitrogenase C-terminal domain-containing protein [Rhizonema sp. NSF051]|nr:Mo-dependent nitrogenase C-terminal domain-containing protein [Rhizonema sp. NSF051]